jgi:hypothetical protein
MSGFALHSLSLHLLWLACSLKEVGHIGAERCVVILLRLALTQSQASYEVVARRESSFDDATNGL